MRWPALLLVYVVTQLSTHHVIAQVNNDRIGADTLVSTQPPKPIANHLLKAGVGLPIYRFSSISLPFVTLALDLTLEQKITGHVFLVGGIENHYLFSQSAQLYTLELPIGLRYYFSVGKRMKQRAEVTPFFRHYVALQTYNLLFADLNYDLDGPSSIAQRYHRGRLLNHISSGGKYQEGLNMFGSIYFTLGTQLKVSKRNYLDMNVIIPVVPLVYVKNEWTLASPALVTIKYGIYWPK